MSLKLMSAVILSSGNLQNNPENPDKLLKQLLECVQECQKRYGGKSELATEFDACVAGLCLCLEAVFLHGLRVKPYSSQNQGNSALKQVSEIVTQSLHIGNYNISFWYFIQRHLTNHEKERYNILKHIWTDIGKCKAWIRSALNEKSLERYFHTVLGDRDILRDHYESWALLRDEDRNSMLPNMAAGLGAILFAISIDRPEFNSSLTPRSGFLGHQVEPIVEVHIPNNREKKKKQNKKHKVARQFISFDEDDDDDGTLSTSVPSISSSSTCSDSSSIGNKQDPTEGNSSKATPELCNKSETMENIHEINQHEENFDNRNARKTKISRRLSIETSGSRDKFSTNVPETLTPVSRVSVGELTPVSVERAENFQSPDASDETLEVPADISAVLTALENKNRADIRKRDFRIKLLMKENEALREQVKRYVSAIQMLRRDDEGLQKALHGLQIEPQPDYKTEAEIYEKKLVQVAEMHAELMDFNVILQQSLCSKDALLERLKSEVERLRGPMATDELNPVEARGSVNVWIPSAFLTGSGSASHHVYQIFLRAGNDEWNIYRRYAQFHALHTDLKKLDPVVGAFDFPPKKTIGKKDSSLVEDRRKRLQIYLRKVIAHWPELAHCNSRFLLEQHLAFFKDQWNEENKNVFSRRSGNSTNYSGL